VFAYGRNYRTQLRPEGPKQQPKLYRLLAWPLLFLFQGGSALSPAAIISPERAQQQAAALAKEVGCPTSSIQEVVSCLRQKPANILNDAQTKVGAGVQVREGQSLVFTNERPRSNQMWWWSPPRYTPSAWPTKDKLVSWVLVLAGATGYKETYKAAAERYVSLSFGCLMYNVEPIMETQLRDEMK
jgi:hypothetical protein